MTKTKTMTVSTSRATKEPATTRAIQVFKAGEQLTAKQISARFGVKNPRALVSSLRMQGYAIYGNPLMNSKGEETTLYRLGNASRKVIAAGYKALAAQKQNLDY